MYVIPHFKTDREKEIYPVAGSITDGGDTMEISLKLESSDLHLGLNSSISQPIALDKFFYCVNPLCFNL